MLPALACVLITPSVFPGFRFLTESLKTFKFLASGNFQTFPFIVLPCTKSSKFNFLRADTVVVSSRLQLIDSATASMTEHYRDIFIEGQ